MKYDDFLLRRADFVLNEARSGFHKRDLAITYVLRTISNHLTVGASKGSFGVKKLNRRISKAALAKRRELNSEAEWHKQTLNEHQFPLAMVWQHVCENCASMTPADLCDLIAKYPFVTVLREEDAKLRHKEVKGAKTPEERYRLAGIEIVSID